MKIRILGNTLRFRVRKSEVTTFQETGSLIETTEFGPMPSDQLSFCLKSTADPELTVLYEPNKITVGVPKHLAQEWTNTELVGFEGTAATGKGKTIEVLVEKDFVCLDRPEEENEGAYPNPNAVC